jgi:hypothetical protein
MSFLLLLLLLLPASIVLSFALLMCQEQNQLMMERILRLERQVVSLSDRIKMRENVE